MGEDNRTPIPEAVLIFPQLRQGSPGCVQEVNMEAVGHLPAFPLYSRDGLCLWSTTHFTVLATTISYMGELR